MNSAESALPAALEDILRLTHRLRAADDASLKSVSSSLSTRQLLRVARLVLVSTTKLAKTYAGRIYPLE